MPYIIGFAGSATSIYFCALTITESRRCREHLLKLEQHRLNQRLIELELRDKRH